MAAILLIGPEGPVYAHTRRHLLRAGYRVLHAPDRPAALSVLGSDPEHLVGIMLATLPQPDAEEMLAAVVMGDRLRSGRTFLLFATDSLRLPASLARLCDELGVPVLTQPRDEQDQNGWDDVRDAVALAMRHFPHDPGVAAHDVLAPDILPSDAVLATPRVEDASDIARELAVGMVVLDDEGKLVGQVTACEWTNQMLMVLPHPFALYELAIPFADVMTVDPESMTARLALPRDALRRKTKPNFEAAAPAASNPEPPAAGPHTL